MRGSIKVCLEASQPCLKFELLATVFEDLIERLREVTSREKEVQRDFSLSLSIQLRFTSFDFNQIFSGGWLRKKKKLLEFEWRELKIKLKPD